jgi:hypothetical protein
VTSPSCRLTCPLRRGPFPACMAWRIEDSVIRGEIDNRTKGRIMAKLWLHGEADPVLVDLTGNAMPDIAGCLFQFHQRGTTQVLHKRAEFINHQHGTAGDVTASQRVRVPDVPLDQWMERSLRGESTPEHWANGIYIEWFSDENGRVVIELNEAVCETSLPEWTATEADEIERAAAAKEAFDDHMIAYDGVIAAADADAPKNHEGRWDEFEHEAFLRANEARTEKYGELLEKYGSSLEGQKIIAREMGWDWLEEELEAESETALSGGVEIWTAESDVSDDGDDEAFDDAPLEPNPETEGRDWVRDPDGSIRHPLTLKATETSTKLWQLVKDDDDLDGNELVSEMTFKGHMVAAKLAGALNSLGYSRDRNWFTAGAVVARLKRALGHLHECQAVMAQVIEQRVMSEDRLAETRDELFALREEILTLMEEFRQM